MISGGDDEHAEDVQREAQDNSLPCYARPECGQAREVDEQKRNRVGIYDVVVLSFFGERRR